MSESTLSLSYADLRKEIAYYVGYGRDSALWTTDRQDVIDTVLRSGLRQFYHPPAIPEMQIEAHDWSFLKPVTSLVTVADDYTYDMPDDFGYIEGPFTYSTETGYREIRIIGENVIRNQRQQYQSSGVPEMAAIRPKTTTGETGQRFEALLWPTPDAAYTLNYAYHVLTNVISSSFPYPYGGQAHSETVLASCLAMAERRVKQEKGIHWENFKECLSSSIKTDGRMAAPYLGYNRDRSDSAARERLVRTHTVTHENE